MHGIPFVIDETPYCLWDWELDRLEQEFLAGVDPGYFEYMAKTHDAGLDGDQPQRAALAIRMTYSHAQETLMSLLGAMVQAPDCIIGWLHKYKNAELESVVRKLHKRQRVLTKLDGCLSWEGLSNLVHGYVSCTDKPRRVRSMTHRFAQRPCNAQRRFPDLMGAFLLPRPFPYAPAYVSTADRGHHPTNCGGGR